MVPPVLSATTTGTFSGSNSSAYSAFGGGNGSPGLRFTPPRAGLLTGVSWAIVTGSGTDTITAYVYSDDGGSPSSPATLLGTSTTTNTTAASGTKSFTFNNVSLAASTLYWIVLSTGGGTATPSLQGVSGIAGYNSGRNATITSIDSTGQNPEALSDDWKVEIRIDV